MERISELEIRIGSLLVSLMICSKLLNTAIPIIYSGGVQAGMLTMGVIWGLYIIYVCVFKKHRANIVAACFLIYILLFFLISNFVYSNHIRLLTVHFIEYGVAGYLIAGTTFNAEKATRYASYVLLILAYPIFVLLHNTSIVYSDSINMGVSYALLSPALTSIAHFLYFRRKKDYLMYIAYAFSAYLLIQIIVRGIRGAILCLLVFAFLSVLNHDRFRGQFSIRRGIILVIIFIGLLNADHIFTYVANMSSSFGIHIQFIEKTLALRNITGDVSNGRLNNYILAINDFLESPIWGKWIGYFPEVHGISYPHNMILQVLGEGGLLLGIPIIIILVRIVVDLIFGKLKYHDLRAVVILLTSCTIPAAFVTDEIWNYQLLWLLYGIIIKKSIPDKKTMPHIIMNLIEYES